MWHDRDQSIGIVSAVVVFLGTWIYCISAYGFLFGFGLGWLPSAILAAMIGFAMIFLWRVVALILWAFLAFALFVMFKR